MMLSVRLVCQCDIVMRENIITNTHDGHDDIIINTHDGHDDIIINTHNGHDDIINIQQT